LPGLPEPLFLRRSFLSPKSVRSVHPFSIPT